jgi:EpsI family protein
MAAKAKFAFLSGRHARVLTIVLLVQIAGFYALSRREYTPASRPLAAFPAVLGSWTVAQEGVVEKEVMDVLKADDVLSRTYVDSSVPRAANLFIAYFKSQRAGQAPHSPKNCLPGSGWVPSESEIVSLAVPGRADPIPVNRYVVAKGDEKSVVLYWYQSRDRINASEYQAKFYLVADAIRYNRTDTALVRVVVAVEGGDTAAATTAAEQFARSCFPALRSHLPS